MKNMIFQKKNIICQQDCLSYLLPSPAVNGWPKPLPVGKYEENYEENMKIYMKYIRKYEGKYAEIWGKSDTN